MNFLLTSTDINSDGGYPPMFFYSDKLRLEGFDIKREGKDSIIEINTVDDILKLIKVVEHEIIISVSYKGDPPQIEIYDTWRED